LRSIEALIKKQKEGEELDDPQMVYPLLTNYVLFKKKNSLLSTRIHSGENRKYGLHSCRARRTHWKICY
jgi:hypothetical protein